MNAAIVTEVGLGMGLFTIIILILVFIILAARSRLVSTGNVKVLVNDERELAMPVGGKLMQGLAEQGILIASACGGGGTCGQCRVQVLSGGGAILPTETSSINKRDAEDHYRLSCQVAVKQDMRVQVPDEVFGVKKYECTVVSNSNVASFIKELVVKLPEGEEISMTSGTATTCGATSPTSSTRLCVPIRWRATRSKRTSSSSTCVSRRRHPAPATRFRQASFRRSSST
jgi:Na+-transporting NADH:ubiquinone oxidoreductase subunit F